MSDIPSKVKPEKVFQPANPEELLRGWLLHAHKGRDRHDLAARQNDTYRYWLGVPAITFATIVGTSVFATLENQVDLWIKIAMGLISITSAVLASLQTFFNHASQSEVHRVTGVKYKIIIRELEQILTQPAKQLQENSDFLNDLRKRLDELELDAPVVPDSIYKRIQDRYDNVVFEDKADELYLNNPVNTDAK